MAEFELFVPHRTVAELAEIVRTNGGSVFRTGLLVRIRGDRMKARANRGGRSSTPATLTGRLVAEAGGTRITGRMHRLASHLFDGAIIFAAVFMAVAATVVAIAEGPGTVGFVVCLVSAILLGLVGCGLVLISPLTRAMDEAGLRHALLARFGHPD